MEGSSCELWPNFIQYAKIYLHRLTKTMIKSQQSIGPLQKQGNELFPLQVFAPVTLSLNNILANPQFSVSAVIQFNIESVMRSNVDHIKFRLLYDIISKPHGN